MSNVIFVSSRIAVPAHYANRDRCERSDSAIERHQLATFSRHSVGAPLRNEWNQVYVGNRVTVADRSPAPVRAACALTVPMFFRLSLPVANDARTNGRTSLSDERSEKGQNTTCVRSITREFIVFKDAHATALPKMTLLCSNSCVFINFLHNAIHYNLTTDNRRFLVLWF